MARPKPISHDAVSVDDEIAALTALVGQHLFAARKQAGMSRRALSECSGVSQRYLAQIEAGDGNISIALLVKLGRAPRIPVEAFLQGHDAGRREASPGRTRRVALIGLRGAGKSTLGKSVAAVMDIPFVELNDEIERISGLSVSDVIALYGAEGYRAFERQALDAVCSAGEEMVLAVAGGIVSAPQTFELLLERFHTVWLRADPQEHMDRVIAQGDERPMAGNPGALDELRAILQQCEPHYARASMVLDTHAKSIRRSQQELLTLLQHDNLVTELS